jgi:hypothetical protein
MTRESQPAKGRAMLPMVATIAALFALLALTPLASAASNPVSSGTTTITLNKGFSKALKKSKVKVLGISPGTVKGSTVTLPVNGGSVDIAGNGTVNQDGGIKFKAGKRTAALKSLVLDTTAKSLSGKLGSKSLKIATLTSFTATRDGFGVDIAVTKLKLTGKAAKELNKKLGFGAKKKDATHKRAAASKTSSAGPFKANQVIGGSTSTTQPTTVGVLPGGNATLQTELPTVKKFAEVLVKFVPLAPATESAAIPPLFTFPIGGGTIGPSATAGTVQTTGGVKLEQAEIAPGLKISMTLNNIWVDLGTKQATVEVSIDSTNQELAKTPGNIGRTSIANVDLTGATIVSDPVNHIVSVSNAKSTLQAVTAATLNEVFAKPLKKENVFVEGDSLGVFAFTVHTE